MLPHCLHIVCFLAAGSALILPSPVKPMILPVSVMGQNTLGNIPMVSNQVTQLHKTTDRAQMYLNE